MQRFIALFCKPEWHAFIACLVLLLFSWPILTILETPAKGFVFFYFFTAWGLVILVSLLVAVCHQKSFSDQNAEPLEEED